MTSWRPPSVNWNKDVTLWGWTLRVEERGRSATTEVMLAQKTVCICVLWRENGEGHGKRPLLQRSPQVLGEKQAEFTACVKTQTPQHTDMQQLWQSFFVCFKCSGGAAAAAAITASRLRVWIPLGPRAFLCAVCIFTRICAGSLQPKDIHLGQRLPSLN